jgi:hypothetical protein
MPLIGVLFAASAFDGGTAHIILPDNPEMNLDRINGLPIHIEM